MIRNTYIQNHYCTNPLEPEDLLSLATILHALAAEHFAIDNFETQGEYLDAADEILDMILAKGKHWEMGL